MRYLVWTRARVEPAHQLYDRIGATEHMMDGGARPTDIVLHSAFIESGLTITDLKLLIEEAIVQYGNASGQSVVLDTIWSEDMYQRRSPRRMIHLNGITYDGEIPREDVARLTEGQEDVLA